MDKFFPITTFLILLINISIFIFAFGSPSELFRSFFLFSQPQKFITSFGLYPNLLIQKPYTLITHMFIHSDWLHLLVNMLLLTGVGFLLEKKIGGLNFLLVYIFSGFFSVLLNILARFIFTVPNFVSIGASGAIFGILSLGSILLPGKKVPVILVPILNLISPFVYLLGFKINVNLSIAMIFYIIFSFLMIFFNIVPLSEISHLGGIFGGLVSFWFLGKKGMKHEKIYE